MTDAPLTLSLKPSPGLALVLAALHAAAGIAIALLGLPAPILAVAVVAVAALAVRTVARAALGMGRGAPVGLVLRLDGSGELARSGLEPLAGRLVACSLRFPGLAVLELATAEGRVGVLITAGRVGDPGWRRLRVLARWGPGAALARGGVNSPPPGGSVGP